VTYGLERHRVPVHGLRVSSISSVVLHSSSRARRRLYVPTSTPYYVHDEGPNPVSAPPMTTLSSNTLPPQVCKRIVRWTRRSDLVALCLTCRALQREAEVKLYETIGSGSVQVTFRACQSITSQARLGPYVRSFYVFQDTRRSQRELSKEFWGAVQRALSKMRSLECLFIHDPVYANSWVLGDIARIPFQLQEARLLFYWDSNLVRFLESQNKLKSLHTFDGPDGDPSLQLEVGSLPELQVFDGSLVAAEHIVPVTTSLTHMQVALHRGSESGLLTFIPRLSLLSSLRALNLLHLSERLAVQAVQLIATTCCTLRHLGLIPLPLPGPDVSAHSSAPQIRSENISYP